MEFSLLQNARDRLPRTVGLEAVADLVRTDAALAGLTEACRAEAAGDLDGQCPRLIVRWIVEGGRQQRHAVRMTGASVAHLRPAAGRQLAELREEACDDPHTLLCFADTAGTGLWVLFAYELDPGWELRLQMQFYPKAYGHGNDYYEGLLRGVADRADMGRTCVLAHDAGVYLNTAAEPFLAWEVKESRRRLREGKRAAKAEGDPKGDTRPWATVESIRRFLADHVLLRHNVVTGRVEVLETGSRAWQPINDRLVNTLWAELSEQERVAATDMQRLIDSQLVPDFHPFRYYLDHLPPWDGMNYILGMSVSVSVKGDVDKQVLFANYLTKWLVGMVAGWVDAEVVNNVILVLVGRQGSYKTTWFNYLLPPELRQYFYTKTNSSRMGRDDLLVLAQYGLVCCEELDTMRPSELNQLKAAMTMPSIDERAAYARYHEHRHHIASFCGTGNSVQFLSDPTGNRRWLPFEVDSIESPREHPFNYEGIYSQAYALYQQGYRYWFTQEEMEQLSVHNRLFETPRLERELVQQYFRVPLETETGIFVSVAYAMQVVGANLTQKLSAVHVGRAFSDLGFKRVKSQGVRGYLAVLRNAQEMASLKSMMAYEAQADE